MNYLKKISLSLCCLSFLVLSACGGTPSSTPPASTPAETDTPETAPTQPLVEEHVFETTVDEIISVLSTNVEGDVTTLPIDITPTTQAWDAGASTVAGTFYTYALFNGATLNITDSGQTGKVQSISLITDVSELTEDTARELGRYQAVLVAMFEPDDAMLTTVEGELNIANASLFENNLYMSTGSIAEYLYVISDGIIMLMIDPIPLSADAQTASDPQSEPRPSANPSSTPISEATLTTGQKNALSTADSYLSFSAFSYSRLIEQLEYEGFTTEEATFAADNCGADWNEQALSKALSYLEFSAFSQSGLIGQLEYEGFTTEEATFAADNCGADWNEQAAKTAQNYLDVLALSRDELLDQLEYEGFTTEQALYGVEAVGY